MNNEEDSKVVQTQIDVGIIKAGQSETNRRLSNIEKKMDAFAFTPKSDFEDFKKYVAENYVTENEFKPMKVLFWGIISAVITAIVLAGLAFLLRRP